MREADETGGDAGYRDAGFMALVAILTLLFAWVLWPFFGAILWGVVAAILFAPLHRRLARAVPASPTLAALATLSIIVLIVIIPFLAVGAALVREASEAYQAVQSGRISLDDIFSRIAAALPQWAAAMLDNIGLKNLADVQQRLSAALAASGQALATRALSIGQVTAGFIINLAVMLYLLFFLIRDGEALLSRVTRAVPLRPARRRALLAQFALVVRATIKGGILVALLQGALGGLIFWFLGIPTPLLWAALMAFLSLIPAVGAGLVWLPVAIYLMATGALWQGAVLIAYGALVIGLVDNLLRPILVGKDTKMPDYVVLVSTLGGIEIFGLNGFVIGPVIAAMFIAAWQIMADDEEAAATDAPPRP
jgi:predicted PurR-regulated permease PerM